MAAVAPFALYWRTEPIMALLRAKQSPEILRHQRSGLAILRQPWHNLQNRGSVNGTDLGRALLESLTANRLVPAFSNPPRTSVTSGSCISLSSASHCFVGWFGTTPPVCMSRVVVSNCRASWSTGYDGTVAPKPFVGAQVSRGRIVSEKVASYDYHQHNPVTYHAEATNACIDLDKTANHKLPQSHIMFVLHPIPQA